ncbi:hypothetical protein D3C87_1320500 [compost metagenome]
MSPRQTWLAPKIGAPATAMSAQGRQAGAAPSPKIDCAVVDPPHGRPGGLTHPGPALRANRSPPTGVRPHARLAPTQDHSLERVHPARPDCDPRHRHPDLRLESSQAVAQRQGVAGHRPPVRDQWRPDGHLEARAGRDRLAHAGAVAAPVGPGHHRGQPGLGEGPQHGHRAGGHLHTAPAAAAGAPDRRADHRGGQPRRLARAAGGQAQQLDFRYRAQDRQIELGTRYWRGRAAARQSGAGRCSREDRHAGHAGHRGRPGALRQGPGRRAGATDRCVRR